ncbi:MAG: GntR family transcriptional regulator [Acidobacteria bacterium]|nr:GntR family transcriptional regulator [Acidobacteriota bacterium]
MVRENTIYRNKLSDHVEDYIRGQVEKGLLRPGDRVNEKEVCQTLGLSRTPVREALIQLNSEGIVEMLPHRAIRIKRHSLKDIRDLYMIISALEAAAAEVAINKFTAEDIAVQEKLYEQMKLAHKRNDFARYKALNDRSHSLLVGKAGNKILEELLAKLKKRFFDFPLILSGVPEWLNVMLSDHGMLIELLKTKDKVGIRKLITEHWSYERNISFENEGKELSS